MKEKMTAKKKRAWLGAIEKLERFYRAVLAGKKPEYFDCPFCIISNGDDEIHDWNCRKCLWVMFDKKDCETYIEKHFDSYPKTLRRTYDVPWAKASLKRLARWRSRLEKEDKKVDATLAARRKAHEKLMNPKRIPK
jgi:hypothetical protein